MNIITNASTPLKLFGAVLALAALIVAALALAAGVGAQAGTPGTAGNTYADPQPCGPGANTAFQPEPHEVTTGHFYLFDTYWQNTTDTQSSNGNTGVLRTNMCPPKLTTTTQTDTEGNTTTETALTDSGIDVDEAIFHVLDKHKTTIVANAAGDPNGNKLRLDHYPEVDDTANVDAGDEVWWLRLDDPDTGTESSPVDETSDLILGFSTNRFDEKYWAGKDDQPAFRYMFEVERNPGIAASEHPHLLAYKKRGADVGGTVARAELVWDSAGVHTTPLTMQPGQLEDLQWVFTKPGTYKISVHLIGWVRESNPDKEGETGYDRNWKRISPNKTETSEVKRYVIQVGSELDETEPPKFGVVRSVPENSDAGTSVGGPIRLFGAEVDTITYTISGAGADQFAISSSSDRNSAQIVVAEDADLDYETKAAYDLVLRVTDNVDHEGNKDDTIDHTLAVRVELEDEAPSVTLSFYPVEELYAGDNATVEATIREAPPGASLSLTWYQSGDGRSWSEVTENIFPLPYPAVMFHRDTVGSVMVKTKVDWGDGNVWSDVITVSWEVPQAPPSP